MHGRLVQYCEGRKESVLEQFCVAVGNNNTKHDMCAKMVA